MDKLTQLQSLLAAVEAGLTVIKTVADLPGVSALPYVSTLSSALGVTLKLAEAGRNIEPQITAIVDTFSDPTVSVEKMAALDAEIAIWSAKLDAPLPPKEAGEPD